MSEAGGESAIRLAAQRWRETVSLLSEAISFASEAMATFAGAVRRSWRELLLALAAGLATGTWALLHWRMMDSAAMRSVMDVWFNADIPRIVATLTDRESTLHYRTAVHPLLSLIVCSPFIAAHAIGASEDAILAAYVFLGGAAFGALLFATLRAMGLRILDSAVFTALACTSAAGVFWLGVPEVCALNAVSLLLPLLWLAARRGRLDAWLAPLQCVVALSITITNGVAGLAAAFAGLGPRRAIGVATVAFAIVAALTPVQNIIYPHVGRFLNLREDMGMMVNEAKDRTTLVSRPISIAVHAFAAPAEAHSKTRKGEAAYILSYQELRVPTEAAGWIALAAWYSLIIMGCVGVVRGVVPGGLALGILGTLAGLTLIYLAYGGETFLYSLNLATLFALLAAGAAKVSRPAALGLALAGILAGGLHNEAHLRASIGFVTSGGYLAPADRPAAP